MTVTVPRPAGIPYWLGGQVDVRVEVDTGAGEGLGALWDEGLWDYNRWGSEDPDWVDFTPYVLGVVIRQGAQRWGDRIETGTATVTVDNTSGIFTPESGVPDPWFREFRPGRKVRIVAIPDTVTGVKVPLFTGRLDAAMGNVSDGGYDITSVLQLHDFMGDWASYDPLETIDTGNQRTDLRVGAALDRYGWPADERDIQTGDHNVTGSTLSETTLEECQIAADAEGGVFYCSKDGLATFKNKDWLTTDTRSTVIQGYLGYDEVPTGAQAAHIDSDLSTSWELARVVNHAAYARAGGTAQESEDIQSQSYYGVRSHKRSDLHNTSDGEVLALAVRMVNARKDLRPRADEITIQGVEEDPGDDLNRLLWDTELGDLLSIQASSPYGWVIEREVHVFGIDHAITGNDWTVTFRLDDAQTIEYDYWILDDPIASVLDQTTRVMQMSNPTFVADELVTAAKMNLLPKGILGYAERTTDQTGITSLVDLTGLTVTVTVVAGRSIRITGQVLFTGGSATSILAIREGSTQLHTGNMLTPGPATEVVHVQRILIPSAGSHTYKLSAQASGTATAVTAAATHPAFILVEDLGVL